MLNLGELVNTVQKNCHISDARHAGDFTMCIFLLKMREFYRWEHDIPLANNLPKSEVGNWMQEREHMWSDLEESSFEQLPFEGRTLDPFDADTVNRELVPQGYVYSGGYGRFCKPHFFLGTLLKKERRAGYTIYITSCEFARDLEAPPAMLQGKTIYVRQESVRRFLWEKIEEWRWNRKNKAMERALACYDFELDAASALERMTQNETEAMIAHELGEGLAGEELGPDWQRMLATISRSKAEIMVRAVRDILADCLSTLPTLLAKNNDAALHFYFANFGGMRKHLFPEAIDAYQRWVAGQDRKALPTLAASGARRWRETARALLTLYLDRGEQAGDAIEKMLEPTVDTTSFCKPKPSSNS
ncbi:MAG: Sfum_1244 family protein [Sulfuricaulis sp.]